MFGNRSFCFEKMQEYEKALIDAELCLNMCPGWVKGLFRKGRALAGLKVTGSLSHRTDMKRFNCVGVGTAMLNLTIFVCISVGSYFLSPTC